uniref:Uncharacterized protein n=1 Tax=Setaria italica TaxID=4555 RepID=K4AI96_SETIT
RGRGNGERQNGGRRLPKFDSVGGAAVRSPSVLVQKRASAATAAADLTDDLIVDILSRLPVKSICRFKCVSRHWHPTPSTTQLSGFFYPRYLLDHEDEITAIPDFVGISGAEEVPFPDPSLPFLPGYRWIRSKDSCGGLLLCGCWKVNPRDEFNYVVCNPAADKWVVLPEPPDDAIFSHFHVFQLLEEDQYGYITGLDIYSSETGAWSHKENGWGDEVVPVESGGVFMNGMLHLLSHESTILAVDTEGKTWSIIPLLERRLCYMNTRKHITNKISVWILEDYSAGQWIFKYNISTSQLFGEVDLMMERDYSLITIHPEANVVFFVSNSEDLLMSYDMDRGKVRVICCSQSLFITHFFHIFHMFHFFMDWLIKTRSIMPKVKVKNWYPKMIWMLSHVLGLQLLLN